MTSESDLREKIQLEVDKASRLNGLEFSRRFNVEFGTKALGGRWNDVDYILDIIKSEGVDITKAVEIAVSIDELYIYGKTLD